MNDGNRIRARRVAERRPNARVLPLVPVARLRTEPACDGRWALSCMPSGHEKQTADRPPQADSISPSGSVRLGTGELDHLGPFFGFARGRVPLVRAFQPRAQLPLPIAIGLHGRR